MLLQKGREGLAENRRDCGLRLHAPEFCLGLPLKLNLAKFDRNDGGESLQHILAGKVFLALLEVLVLSRVRIERARQRGLEAGEMRAAFTVVDVVCKRQHARG